MSHPMPGAGLARSEPRPSQYVFPNNKLSFINKPLPTTASSNKYCVKCAISARKCCWVRSRESANGRAKNFPKQPYLSAIPVEALAHVAAVDQQKDLQAPTEADHRFAPSRPSKSAANAASASLLL